ncbi:50S ribosomal protein L4 [bacterium]|nr:50S ribosomal protein L4 [bacterium]
MPTVAVRNLEGKEVSQLDLASAIFESDIKLHCVRQAVNRQLARRRLGTASTRNRALVTGSNAKPWAQKGTGRARAGTRKSPIWRGGGTVFGPSPREYGGQINRKVLRSALLSCLSAYARDQEIIVLDTIDFDKPRTRQVADLVRALDLEGKRVLFVTDETNFNLALSARNVPGIDVINCANLNTYDLTTHDALIATSAAIKRIEETYA